MKLQFYKPLQVVISEWLEHKPYKALSVSIWNTKFWK